MATIEKLKDIVLENNSVSYNLDYKNIDNLIGEIKSNTIITIGARPGMGKTSFLNNVIINLLNNYNLPTLYISLDSSKEKIISDLASISNKSVKELQNSNYNLYISTNCFNISDLEKLLEENEDIKVLAIDYIQLLSGKNTFTSMADSYSDILSCLKVMAEKYNLVILLTSQLSRNVELRMDKEHQIKDLGKTSALEEISDIIMFLYHEDYYIKESKNKLTEVIVAKNRYGKTGITYLNYKESKYID